MTEEEAIQTAREWVKVRRQVRAQLIRAARARNPADGEGLYWDDSELRKLYQFPSDLSEQRLLDLIDREPPIVVN